MQVMETKSRYGLDKSDLPQMSVKFVYFPY